MVIVNAIREADTEYVVYFLLQAYLNTESRRQALARIAPEIAAVPVRGQRDVTARYEWLKTEFAARRGEREARAAIKEALAVFGAAVLRLHAFADAGASQSAELAAQAAGALPVV